MVTDIIQKLYSQAIDTKQAEEIYTFIIMRCDKRKMEPGLQFPPSKKQTVLQALKG